MSAPQEQPIPEHVKLAVIEAMRAKDLDRITSLSPADQAAAQRYITSLLAYDILHREGVLMPVTTADVPNADKPAEKPAVKPKLARSGLADAAASSDPLVMKLMWDRGARESGGEPVDVIDAQLRELGFDV